MTKLKEEAYDSSFNFSPLIFTISALYIVRITNIKNKI